MAASALSVPPIDRERDSALADARAWWTKYEWPERGDEWSGPFGSSDGLWFGGLYPRLRGHLPGAGRGTILEIGPGFGRVSNYLRRYCERLILVDLAPKCVENCRRRFVTRNDGEGGAIVECHVNDGRSLAMVENGTIDLAVSYDALVHAEPDVIRGYLGQLRAKLRVGEGGGAAFIHHSNLGEQFPAIAHEAEKHVLGGRNREMSAARLRDDCQALGLACTTQELIPSGEAGLYSDCFSLIVRAEDVPARMETQVVRRDDWATEVWTIQRIDKLYRAPAGVG